MLSSGDTILIRWQDSIYIVEESGLQPVDTSGLADNNLRRNIAKYDLLMAAGESFALANMDHSELTSTDAFIFSRDYGYSFEPIKPAPSELSVEIDHVEIQGVKEVPSELDNLDPGQKNIIIRLRKQGDLTFSDNLQYLLEPSDATWLPVPASGALSFQNLASETYALHIRDGYGNSKELVSFNIPAPWHLSWPGGVLYTSTVIMVALLWNRSVRKRTADKARSKHADEVRRIEAERIRHNNEQLQREVQLKSKLLANRAMALAQKNKLLLQMKDLAQAKPASESASSEMRSRIIRMVDQHTDHEDEWKVFESNFDEVHEQFTERLLEAHPNLTAGDKRLASFIRMDLSSKEIAPLLRISVRSVENKRHRLRKKMRLESGQRLNEYLMRF
jgi:DNA-binding CsgD family transcriptional regulator